MRIIARLNIGGPAIHAVLLSAGMESQGFETMLACGSPAEKEGDMEYFARAHGVKPYLIPEMGRELDFFADSIALIKLLRLAFSFRPQIIHTHTAKAGALGRLAGIAYNLFSPEKAKLAHTFHGHIFRGYFARAKTKLFILIERALAGFSDRVITVSKTLQDELVALRICPAEKISVVPLGLELDEFLEIPPRRAGTVNIGIVGRLVPVKNHRLFLDAAVIFIRENPGIRARFYIVGGGELEDELKAYAKDAGLEGRVVFSGWQRELAPVYAQMDIAMLTSLNEGTPVSLIEAMAAGRVVIAADAGGVKDLLGEEKGLPQGQARGFRLCQRGILVHPAEAGNFVAAVNFAIREKEIMRQTIVCARDFARDNFAKDRLIKDIARLYTSLL
jgi:glycosyltransferase involved in cell wall biosynthesis